MALNNNCEMHRLTLSGTQFKKRTILRVNKNMEGGAKAFHISVHINKHTPIHTSYAQHTAVKVLLLSPALSCVRIGEKETKATERALPLCLFHPFSKKQWQDLMEYIIPFPFCMRCLKALIKIRNPTMHTLYGTHKNTCEFKATELRKVVPTFPPVHYLYSRFLKWHCNLMMHQPIILSSRTNILAFSL